MSEILEHATRLFAERGYDGTTLQDIADAIGITRPGLYNYISSKEQLLAALVRDVSENTAHIVRAVRLRADLSSVEKLRTVVRGLVLQRAGAPERFRVLDRTEAALPEEVASLHLKARREVLAAGPARADRARGDGSAAAKTDRPVRGDGAAAGVPAQVQTRLFP